MAEKAPEYNAALLNAIAPAGIKDSTDNHQLSIGDVTGQCFGVIRYPSSVDYEWLTEVCNLNNTITTLAYTPQPPEELEELTKRIGQQITNNRMVVDGLTSADPIAQNRAKKELADGEKMLNNILNNNQSIGNVSINNYVFAENKTELTKNIQSVKNKYIGKRFNVRPQIFQQLETYEAMSPFNTIDTHPKVTDVTDYLMPLETMFGGFPFAFSGYNDGEGTYWGKDSSGGLVVVDLWRRGEDRVNSNLVLQGMSGMGKSTIVKHLLQNEWECGTKIIIIDPNGEYKDMATSPDFNGDWIDVTTGDGGHINPLQVYKKPRNEENPQELELSELALHINSLEVFFKLYLSMSETLSHVLKECLEETYRRKGITWQTDFGKLKPEDYPIMSDLYNTVLDIAQEKDETLRLAEQNYYKELAILLRNIAVGSDSFIWNHHSSVNPTSSLIVFDTSSVNNTSDNVRKALYNTVLSYCKELLYRDKNERVILIMDEAHTAIDPRIPETVADLNLISRTVRKNEAGLWIISHQLQDFLDNAIRKDGEALLEQPNVKLFMPVGKGRNLKELRELYSFTDAEEERLLQQQRGKGLLFIGSRRLSIDFEIPPHHLLQMGTGGGR